MPPHLTSRRKGDIRAIFVHAGAGFHSITNERLHLKACEDACIAAMAILKNGGTAVDAVEMAIKVLEDREITNAGYGSNLAVDGAVECDAIVVDHYGRSGAVGAVSQIKNPVSLARLILDRSTRPLLLRRVPPNLLCGEGATHWAHEQGLQILPHHGLVSPAAQERWQKWVEDLKTAESRQRKRPGSPAPRGAGPGRQVDRIAHRERMLRSRDPSQLPSPPTTGGVRSGTASPSSPSVITASSRATMDDVFTPSGSTEPSSAPPPPPLYPLDQATRNPLMNSTQKVPTLYDVADTADATDSDSDNAQITEDEDMADVDDNLPEEWTRHPPRARSWHDGSSGDSGDESSRSTLQLPSLTPSPPNNTPVELNETSTGSPTADGNQVIPSSDRGEDQYRATDTLPAYSGAVPDVSAPPRNPRPLPAPWGGRDDDLITDTVGAIAIDIYGNIAAAASSGGIGMKHQGRVGPAALVGVGASVIPVQEGDSDRQCVATVTSGTGEHMATTAAAQTCSDRVYHGLKKGGRMTYLPHDGQSLDPTPAKGLGIAEHDDDVVRSFVEHDFMNHPSVKHSISAGAIGILTIKKTKYGAYMYFAHNTDSFALASMHANESKPVVCMSRSAGNGSIAQGGRAMRFRRSV